jgi:hypothetical protein
MIFTQGSCCIVTWLLSVALSLYITTIKQERPSTHQHNPILWNASQRGPSLGQEPSTALGCAFFFVFLFLAFQFQESWEITSKFLQKKGIPFYVPFFARVTFQEFLFAGTMFLQKLVPFLPLPPKLNNSPACRPKTSKRCHTQQQNLQQRISVATLVGHSSYLLPSPPCQILQLACLPLINPSHPSCLVGCCVARWPPSISQPGAPPLVMHSVCWLSCGIAS